MQFNVTFFGKVYNQIFVGSNGYLTFESGSAVAQILLPETHLYQAFTFVLEIEPYKDYTSYQNQLVSVEGLKDLIVDLLLAYSTNL